MKRNLLLAVLTNIVIKLSAFSLNVLKKIMKDYHPQYTNDIIYWHYTHFRWGS